jgi:hypothetical protein
MKSSKPNNIYKIVILFIVGIIQLSCLSNHSKPSQVDISVLENLTNYPMYSIEELKERFAKLEYKEGVRDFRSHVWKGDVGRSWVYSYSTPIVNHVYLWIYDNSKNAKNHFEKYDKNSHKRLENRIVEISENVEIILWHSVMYRGADNFYGYDDVRHLYTCIRIGNIIIDLYENYYENETLEKGMPTTNNIEMIYKVLIE